MHTASSTICPKNTVRHYGAVCCTYTVSDKKHATLFFLYVASVLLGGFLPRDATQRSIYSRPMSVRSSVRLLVSVTSRHCTKIAKSSITQTTPYDSPEILVFLCLKPRPHQRQCRQKRRHCRRNRRHCHRNRQHCVFGNNVAGLLTVSATMSLVWTGL